MIPVGMPMMSEKVIAAEASRSEAGNLRQVELEASVR